MISAVIMTIGLVCLKICPRVIYVNFWVRYNFQADIWFLISVTSVVEFWGQGSTGSRILLNNFYLLDSHCLSKKEVFQKLKFLQKCSPKVKFRNEDKTQKDLESDLGTFWQPFWKSLKVESKEHFSRTDFWVKVQSQLTLV